MVTPRDVYTEQVRRGILHPEALAHWNEFQKEECDVRICCPNSETTGAYATEIKAFKVQNLKEHLLTRIIPI